MCLHFVTFLTFWCSFRWGKKSDSCGQDRGCSEGEEEMTKKSPGSLFAVSKRAGMVSLVKKEKKLPQQSRILSASIRVAAVGVGTVKRKEHKFETAKRRKRRDVAVAGIEAVTSVEFGGKELRERFILELKKRLVERKVFYTPL